MARVKKFEQGEPFESLDEFADWCRKGNYVWVRGKPTHGAWCMSWQFNMVRSLLPKLRKAAVREEWIEAEKEGRITDDGSRAGKATRGDSRNRRSWYALDLEAKSGRAGSGGSVLWLGRRRAGQERD